MLVFGTLHLMIFPWISVDVYSELGDTFCRTQKFCFVGVVHLLAFQSVILIHEWDCFFLLFITKIKSATFLSKDLLIFFCLFNYLVRNQPGGFITVDYLKLFIHYIQDSITQVRNLLCITAYVLCTRICPRFCCNFQKHYCFF